MSIQEEIRMRLRRLTITLGLMFIGSLVALNHLAFILKAQAKAQSHQARP